MTNPASFRAVQLAALGCTPEERLAELDRRAAEAAQYRDQCERRLTELRDDQVYKEWWDSEDAMYRYSRWHIVKKTPKQIQVARLSYNGTVLPELKVLPRQPLEAGEEVNVGSRRTCRDTFIMGFVARPHLAAALDAAAASMREAAEKARRTRWRAARGIVPLTPREHGFAVALALSLGVPLDSTGRADWQRLGF